MSSLADRLRGIVAAVPGASARAGRTQDDLSSSLGAQESQRAREAAADVLDGQWVDVGGHRVLVIDHLYRPGYRHGRLSLLDHILPDQRSWAPVLLPTSRLPAPERAWAGASAPAYTAEHGQVAGDEGRILFVDLETTGLAGGAGTYAFLVGCAWFEDCSFRVRQLFMSSAALERAMLDLLDEIAAPTRLVVSFNGKTFDLPLVETRYLFHRRETPLAGVPHLDMLHTARRLWRPDEDDDTGTPGSCRLSALEQTVCGHVREGDVPGFEIPARYFHFVRTGDARPLVPVLEHNRLDLLSLAFLTSRASQLVVEGAPALRSAREALGLGQLLERAGDAVAARRCYARAAGLDGPPLPGDDTARAEALHAYAVLCRRERRFLEAADIWRRLLDVRRCPPGLARSAWEALAVHHEHRSRDLDTARDFALRSVGLQPSPARQKALQHRLARLDQKLMAQPLSLF